MMTTSSIVENRNFVDNRAEKKNADSRKTGSDKAKLIQNQVLKCDDYIYLRATTIITLPQPIIEVIGITCGNASIILSVLN